MRPPGAALLLFCAAILTARGSEAQDVDLRIWVGGACDAAPAADVDTTAGACFHTTVVTSAVQGRVTCDGGTATLDLCDTKRCGDCQTPVPAPVGRCTPFKTRKGVQLAMLATGCGPAPPPAPPAPSPPAPPAARGWQQSYKAGYSDSGGRYAGGSEVLHLEGHGGRLFAANGYWEDDERNPPFAQVLMLDKPGGEWKVELETQMTARMENLNSITIGGTQLLVAGAWELATPNVLAHVYVRDDSSGKWAQHTISSTKQESGTAFQWQASTRAMQVHRDTVTGVEYLFITVGTQGIFKGVYDASLPGKINWETTSDTPRDLGARPMAMIEWNGQLIFAAGRYIYARKDGETPTWSSIVDMGTTPGQSIGGIRGVTQVPNPNGGKDSIIFSWAPDRPIGCIFRVDPDLTKTQETCLNTHISKYLGVSSAANILAMYNRALPVQDPKSGKTVHLIGMEATVRGGKVPTAEGDYYAGAMFAIRRSPTDYQMNEVGGRRAAAAPVLIANRASSVSPFPSDEAVYFGGYDCNNRKAHNTAWVFRGDTSSVLTPGVGGNATRSGE